MNESNRLKLIEINRGKVHRKSLERKRFGYLIVLKRSYSENGENSLCMVDGEAFRSGAMLPLGIGLRYITSCES
jgi:hypothetical protein